MKIDIVYTWVSCSDENWITKKNQHLSGDIFSKEQVSDERYTDNDELRVSLRSIFKYMGFINHIYIITDNQKPEWLKMNDKITIIDHSEVIPKQYLPTFNSSVIESFLHKIDNLSEYFIYFNDDFLLGRECHPSDFFANKKIKIQTTSILPKSKKSHSNDYDELSMIESKKIIDCHLGKTANYKFRHGPKAMIKSRLEYIEKKIPSKLRLSDKFRTTPFSFIYTYLYHELNTKNSTVSYQKHIRKSHLLNFLYKNTFVHISKKNEVTKLPLIKTERPMIICVNSISKPLLKFDVILDKYPKNDYFER